MKLASVIKKRFAVLAGFGMAGCCFFSCQLFSQNTTIRGFVAAETTVTDGKLSFGLSEQDLFITSQLSDRISFLGESVFKYDPESHTEFSVSIERVVVKFNVRGNHNILVGKHHTPLNYWNDTYHHGRLFFPTIERPLLFAAGIVPLHTTGVDFQGMNLGKFKFGYDVMIGNGLGSSEIMDNDKYKAIVAAIHIKPVDRLRIGATYYNDVISKDANIHGRVFDRKVKQQLYSGSVAFFGKKFEVLAEGTLATNNADTIGRKNALASYLYAGYRIKEKWVPYFRVDVLDFDRDSYFFPNNNAKSFLLGLRYQLNFLSVIKLEYEHRNFQVGGKSDRLVAQVAIGF